MLLQRFLVALVLLPIGLWVIILGGIPYAAVIALLVGLAAWEFARLFQAGGAQPNPLSKIRCLDPASLCEGCNKSIRHRGKAEPSDCLSAGTLSFCFQSPFLPGYHMPFLCSSVHLHNLQ